MTTYLIDGATTLPESGDTGWGTTLNTAIQAIDNRFTYSGGTARATYAQAAGIQGTTLASNVVTSSLTAVGTLTALTVSGTTVLGPAATNAQVDSYTLALSDAGKIVEINKSSGITLTVPTNSVAAFPVGTQITVVQIGTGQITVAGAGVTLQSLNSYTKTSGQFATATLVKRATDTWLLYGDLAA